MDSSRLPHCIIQYYPPGGKNPGHPLRRPEDCGIEVEIVAINHISALYVINI
jgi:hypothetical protein